MKVRLDGTIETQPVQEKNLLVPFEHDYISLSQNATQDIWTYKTGGAGGTTVATVTVTYTSSAKEIIDTIVRT